MLPEEVMSESDFSLNGLRDRYSYSISSYSSGNDSASSDRFEMDVGISFTPPFNSSSTINSSVGAYMNNNSVLPDNDTYQDLYEVSAGITALLSFFYGSVSVVAVVGNVLVMWIVATSRRMQNVTNCFIANLALADIVIGLFVIPFQFQAALLQRWNLPHFMCPFCPFVQVLSVNVSVFTLTAIAVDRHRAILQPLSASPSKMCAKLVIAGIWVISAALAAPMAFALRVTYVEYTLGHPKPFCQNFELSDEAMLSYRVVLLVLQYLTPLCIISCVYIRMALTLWGSKTPGNAQSSRDATLMKNKKKVIKMLVMVVVLFALCWLPLQTYNVLQDIFPEINGYRYINIIWFCSDWLAMSNSCYNPFIYGIYNEKFKREFQLRFGLWSRRCTSHGSSLSRDLSEMEKLSVRYDSSFRVHSTCQPPGRRDAYRCLPAQQTRTKPISFDEKY